MSMESRVSPVEASVRKKQPLILWLRVLQILSLVLVFAAGYSYSKMVIRFQPNQQSRQQPNHQPNQQTGAGNRAQPVVKSSLSANHSRSVAKTSTQISRPSIEQNPTGNIQTTGSSSPALANATLQSFPTTTFASMPVIGDDRAAMNSSATLQPPPGAGFANRNSPDAGSYGTVAMGPIAYVAEFPMASTASPEETAANSSVAMMVAKIQQAKEEDKPELSAALKKQLVELFKLRHAAQAKEIEEMEKQLEQAKTLHTKRNEKQDEIVERRFRHLMNELDDLDWDRGVKSPVAQPYHGAGTITTSSVPYSVN